MFRAHLSTSAILSPKDMRQDQESNFHHPAGAEQSIYAYSLWTICLLAQVLFHMSFY